LLFCLLRLGLNPRIATERSDSGASRIDKILELVRSSRYSIHDLSRRQAQAAKEHYRLNMPFELGIDFGCRRFGSEPLSEKIFLVLEEKQYRYQAAISDLAGFDIKSHNGNASSAVRQLCNWIKDQGGFERLEASRVYSEYEDFRGWNLKMRRSGGATEEDLRDSSTVDLMRAMREWFKVGSPRN